MRRNPNSRTALAVCGALVMLACACPLRGEIIDRIAVSVGSSVITVSDLDREIRVVAFLNGAPPDFTPAQKRATVERMVEQKLVQKELESSRYPAPSAKDVEPALDKFRKEQSGGAAGYAKALADYGITNQDVVDELLWQRTLLLFIDVRFRPGVQVSDEEIRRYFDDVVKPAVEAAHSGDPAALEAYRDRIEETLIGPRVDQEVDQWLLQARQRAEIVYHEEALQ